MSLSANRDTKFVCDGRGHAAGFWSIRCLAFLLVAAMWGTLGAAEFPLIVASGAVVRAGDAVRATVPMTDQASRWKTVEIGRAHV